MNLFLVGGDAGRAVSVLESLREPFLGDGVLTRLPDGASLSHPASRVGGVQYCITEGGRYALFSGRPIVWNGEEADGRSVLDPALYLRGVPEGMDGRFAVVVDGEVVTDPLGAYPVYRRGSWISNSPEALRRVGGAEEPDLDALAGVLGGGWSLSGAPVWKSIERVDWAGRLLTASGAGFSAKRAARLLVAAVRALGDWPGRPNVVLATGGRDSRLIVAAAVAAGIQMEIRTGGTDDMPDVVLGRQLAAAVGAEHRMLDPHPFGDFLPHWREMASVLRQTTGGTATLADAAGFPLVALDGPLPLWHTGQGGEIARGYYGGSPDLVEKFLGRRPGRASVLSADGERRVRNGIIEWTEEVGGPPEDLGDLFYLHQRMARWAAPTHAAVEPVRDSTSALWSWRLLPDMLGLPAGERAKERFHLEVLEILAPELVDLPFEGGRPWPARQTAVARRAGRARALAGKVRGELRRRWAGKGVPQTLSTAQEPWWGEIAEAVRSQPEHPAWAVLDREEVEALLARGPEGWDAMQRAYVLRLASAFAQ